jgi:hypothetical protein
MQLGVQYVRQLGAQSAELLPGEVLNNRVLGFELPL